MSMHSTAARSDDRDMIPKPMLWGMLALVLLVLSLTTFAVVTGRPHEGRPAEAAILEEKSVVLEGHGARAVTVKAPDGTVLADLSHGGFIAVIQNGLERARTVKGVAQDAPVRLVRYANGRLTVIDPETGWSAELGAFGGDNRAAFEKLMAE